MISSWDFPEVIIAAVLIAVAVSVWLMRFSRGQTTPDFECGVCGRRAASVYAKEWRYCPYCGVPKGSKSMRDLPNRPPSWAFEEDLAQKTARRR